MIPMTTVFAGKTANEASYPIYGHFTENNKA